MLGCHCRCSGGRPPGQSGWGPDACIRVSALGLTPLSRELGLQIPRPSWLPPESLQCPLSRTGHPKRRGPPAPTVTPSLCGPLSPEAPWPLHPEPPVVPPQGCWCPGPHLLMIWISRHQRSRFRGLSSCRHCLMAICSPVSCRGCAGRSETAKGQTHSRHLWAQNTARAQLQAPEAGSGPA